MIDCRQVNEGTDTYESTEATLLLVRSVADDRVVYTRYHVKSVDAIDIFLLHDCNNSNFVCVQFGLINLCYKVYYFIFI